MLFGRITYFGVQLGFLILPIASQVFTFPRDNTYTVWVYIAREFNSARSTDPPKTKDSSSNNQEKENGKFFLLKLAKEEPSQNIKGRGANRKDLGGALRGWDYDDYNENNVKLKHGIIRCK